MLAGMTLPLALSGDQWIALAGVLSGVFGFVGGYVFAYFNGKAERAHGERLARSGRLHEQRFAAYKEVARLLKRQSPLPHKDGADCGAEARTAAAAR
jgi:hypothetical protein